MVDASPHKVRCVLLFGKWYFGGVFAGPDLLAAEGKRYFARLPPTLEQPMAARDDFAQVFTKLRAILPNTSRSSRSSTIRRTTTI